MVLIVNLQDKIQPNAEYMNAENRMFKNKNKHV